MVSFTTSGASYHELEIVCCYQCMREGCCSRPMCVCVCSSSSCTSASAYIRNQRYSLVSLRRFLDFDSSILEKNLPFKSYGMKKPICKLVRAHREPFSRSLGTNETQQLRERQLVGRMLLQRLATGATGVKQARYRRGPTRGSEALIRTCAVY